ncbi:MAG: TAXI family TRAP transporter solute-binding subunit [Sulfolobales archaeon]|nr:TAXI family TRAP transporter solute-binding subunit [Sulfolobales archaeon]MCX8185828.1 TAXI family TRAP transporter solute-binding subunit [Sulfolobales archaeon]MDW7969287.1 TAXI family TRAP transporter solute-binding subunit [Sulfolobales archaeon]
MSSNPSSKLVGVLIALIFIAGVGGYFAGSSSAPAKTVRTTATQTITTGAAGTATVTVTQTLTRTVTVTSTSTSPPPITTPATPFRVRIFTGGTGGVYYPLGTAIAELMNKYSGGFISATGVTSGASVSNARALGAKDAEFALIQNDIAYYAIKGIYMFNGSPISNIRGVVSLYPEFIHIVVRADSGIKNLYDLAGKRVAVGAPGSGAAVEAEILLRGAGIWDKLTPQYLDYNQGAEALKLGQIEGIVICTGIGTSAIVQLGTTTPIKILSIPDEVANKLTREYKFFVSGVIPSGSYPGQTEDAKTLAVMAIIVVRDDIPEDIVYKFLEVMFDRLDELKKAHARAGDISRETALKGMSISLHPGAVKFFESKGITVPADLRP